MQTSTLSAPQQNRRLLYFVLAWLVINLVQACLTGLDGDEAYYWTYARHLQWGYFDHPPMVALSILLGELWGHGYFFTRLGAVCFSAATLYVAFRALPERLQDVNRYVLVFASVLIFHIYGFVTTPDPPLLFFTAVFFFAYKNYLEKEDLTHALWVALSISGMIYSKYHGVLPVFFVFLSNPRLVRKKSAWFILMVVLLCFLPHLWWQYSHGWPTVRYHLFERSQGTYHLDKTTNYLLGQLLVFGPLTTAVALFGLLKWKPRGDLYLRAHVFTFFGVLLFFFFSSFKKNIEPHWTLIAGLSFVVLVLDLLKRAPVRFRRWFFVLCTANIVLVFAARILMAVPGSPAKYVDRFQVQIYSHAWADSLYRKAAGTPVVFVDNYTYPSVYQYYHPDQLSTCYSSVYYRKNNYTLQDQEAFNNRSVYTERQVPVEAGDIEVKSPYVPTFLHRVDSFRAINGLRISCLTPLSVFTRGETVRVTLELENPMHYAINGRGLFINYTLFRSKNEFTTSDNLAINENQLSPGWKKTVQADLRLPEVSGKYRLIFSFDQRYLGPIFASPFYDIIVK